MGQEELGVFYGDDFPPGIEAGSGDDGVDVGVEVEALVPGVEDHGEAAGGGSEPAGVGQAVGEGGGGGGEEELIDVFGLRGEEEGAEFFGQGEGDHEVGGTDAFA